LIFAHALPPPLGGVEDRAHDRRVARAATDVAADRLVDLVDGRVGVAGEQGLGRHDHAGRAEAALGGEPVEEGLLDVAELGPVGEPLDGRDVGAVDGGRGHEAGDHRRAVDQDRARAAGALRASALGTGQAELFPQG
jgi:hypothetical protein